MILKNVDASDWPWWVYFDLFYLSLERGILNLLCLALDGSYIAVHYDFVCCSCCGLSSAPTSQASGVGIWRSCIATSSTLPPALKISCNSPSVSLTHFCKYSVLPNHRLLTTGSCSTSQRQRETSCWHRYRSFTRTHWRKVAHTLLPLISRMEWRHLVSHSLIG